MSLIDPYTPAGFFHLRLVPLKTRLLKKGKVFFPVGATANQESYFEQPPGEAIESDSEYLVPGKLLQRLREHWEAEENHGLAELADTLKQLHNRIMSEARAEKGEEPELSDFVYPLF